MASIVEIGALTFHRLGRDDDAFKLARFAITHEGTIKKTIVSSCHLILAKVAAKRGNRDEADGHFASALEEANLSRLPMLELLAARDWKKHLLEPNGRDCSKAERKRSMLRALKQRRRGGGYVVGVVVGVEDQGSGISDAPAPRACPRAAPATPATAATQRKTSAIATQPMVQDHVENQNSAF